MVGKNKPTLLKKTAMVNLLVLAFFVYQSTLAQKIYIRVSERECINCYAGFFSELIASPYKKDFKFLFPKNYKGKRFEQFNKLYFESKVTPDRAVFSDSLYDLTNKFSNDFSGIIYFHNNQVISASNMTDLISQKINFTDYIKSLTTVNSIAIFHEIGISNRLSIAVSYNANYFAIADFLFKNLFLWDFDGKLTTLDFKDEAFQQLLKSNLTEEHFNSHQKYREELNKYGKKFPEPYSISFTDEQITVAYTVPYVFLKQEDRQEFHIMPLLSISAIALPSKKLNVEQLIENSYIENRTQTEYLLSMSLGSYNDNFYRINQLMYNTHDFAENKIFPFLTKLEKSSDSKNKNLVTKDLMGIENFSFQQDTLLNKPFLMDILFSNIDSNVLLHNYPYVVDIAQKKKHTLDWDSNLNHYYYPPKMTYEQLQFWQSENGFTILVKTTQQYLLKTYNHHWKLVQEKVLPFNILSVKNLRFTKASVYVFTENEVFTMANIFEL